MIGLLVGRLIAGVGKWKAYALLSAFALALAVAAIATVHAKWRGQYRAGWNAALVETSKQQPARRDTVRIATAKTDTVYRTYARQVGHVQETAKRIHDTVRVAFPVVDTLIKEVDTLADSLPRLQAAVITERTAHEALALSLSANIVAQRDTILTLKKRPTKKRLWLQTVGAFGAGVVGTLLIHRQ